MEKLAEELDATESKLTSTQQKLHEAEKQADESERARKVLETRGMSDDQRLTRLEAELADLTAKNEKVETEYDEACASIGELEENLDAAEANSQEYEDRV